jgi:DNA-binding MarR family transcriptional regulator
MTFDTRNVAPPEVAARLRAAIARLSRKLRQQQPAGQLTLSQWSALVTIETRGAVRIGDLAELEHVSAPTATRLVASLEEAGLLQRVVDEADRRSASVSLNAAGRRALAQARRLRAEQLAKLLATWPAADVAQLVAALPLLERLADE